MAIAAGCAYAAGPPPAQPAGAGAAKPIVIDLQEALRRARAYSQQFQTAATNAAVARESRRQARAAELPTVDALNQFIYTQGNGTPSGVFVANDGVHVYNEQAIVRENLFSLFRRGKYRQASAAEALAVAQREIAARGLVLTVTQDYYNLAAAQRKVANAVQALDAARNFVNLTEKQERAGDISHVNVVKAQLQLELRDRDLLTAKLAAEQARLTLAVLLFPGFDQNFTIADDLSTLQPLGSWGQVKALAFRNNPELRAAQASVREAHSATTVARYAYLPALAVNFYYGIDANQFAAEANNVSG
ncbi:MAG: TolC family protein, partial [Rhodanobacteraceae bacterium]